MTTREAQSPLILTLKHLVIAVDPDSGTERWRRTLTTPVGRLFLVGEPLFVTYDTRIDCFDYRTGTPRGTVDIGFYVTAGFVRGQRLFVAGKMGAACVSLEGNVLWRCKSEPHSIGLVQIGDSETLTATNGAGERLWTAEVTNEEDARHDAGLLLEGLVAQPDH